jgi:uncharacterized protein with HEPN domain
MERDSVYIKQILDCIERIEDHVAGMSADDFYADTKTQDAAAYLIGVIGEAANKLSEEARKKYANIPWNQVRGMRNRLFHDYRGTDWSIVWQTVAVELPSLKKELTL